MESFFQKSNMSKNSKSNLHLICRHFWIHTYLYFVIQQLREINFSNCSVNVDVDLNWKILMSVSTHLVVPIIVWHKLNIYLLWCIGRDVEAPESLALAPSHNRISSVQLINVAYPASIRDHYNYVWQTLLSSGGFKS